MLSTGPLLDVLGTPSAAEQQSNLDNAATTPALACVVARVLELLPWYGSINRGAGVRARVSSDAYEGSRATVHRTRAVLTAAPVLSLPRPRPARALTEPQQKTVLDALHAPRFADQAPAEIYATLLDEGVYHCSIRTMYRLLDQNGEIRERRQQLRHPAYQNRSLWRKNPMKSGLGTSPS